MFLSPGLLRVPSMIAPTFWVPEEAVSWLTRTALTDWMAKPLAPPKAAPKAVDSTRGAMIIIASAATLR